jgi:iron(III) transport system permease protein
MSARPGRWPSPWLTAAAGAAALVSVPVLAVLSSLASPAVEVWHHLWQTQLVELVANTAALLLGVGVGVLLVGAALAWLVVAYDFPGRRLFEWALVLPLAMPAYVIGFALLGVLDYPGPVQTWLRGRLGGGLRLPELRSWGGVVLTMTLVFYPYVYLLARTAFREHGAATFETARSLGRSRGRAFLEVVLPVSRPALAAGVALACMEALADFGTVATFGYRTLTEAIYRVWLGMFDRVAATQLASLALLFALILLSLERALRRRARFAEGRRRGEGVRRVPLRGGRAAAAATACAAVLFLGFGLPVAQLLVWAVEVLAAGRVGAEFLGLLANTLTVAALAALAACGVAMLLAYAGRLEPSRTTRAAAQVASMGYAVPGAVIAVGILLPLAGLDHALAWLLEQIAARPTALLLTGSAAGLVFAYVVRFLAVSYHTLEASLARIAPSLDEAARSLGVGSGGVLRRVHLPLLRRGVVTAFVLVLVETMKEMPATLLLRPFGWDTLAVKIWEWTSESMWAEAAVPALALVAAGLLPVFLAIRLGDRRG